MEANKEYPMGKNTEGRNHESPAMYGFTCFHRHLQMPKAEQRFVEMNTYSTVVISDVLDFDGRTLNDVTKLTTGSFSTTA